MFLPAVTESKLHERGSLDDYRACCQPVKLSQSLPHTYICMYVVFFLTDLAISLVVYASNKHSFRSCMTCLFPLIGCFELKTLVDDVNEDNTCLATTPSGDDI